MFTAIAGIFTKVPKSLWVILATVLLLTASNYYTANKMYDAGVADEREANRTAADRALIIALQTTRDELEQAVRTQQEALRRTSVLRDDLSSSKGKIQELERQLKDATNTIHPDCDDLSPELERVLIPMFERPESTTPRRD